MPKTLFTNTSEEQEFERMMQEIPKPPPRGAVNYGREFYFKDRAHQKRWKTFIEKRYAQTATLGFMAALYLLSGDDFLWNKAQGKFHGTIIEFDRIKTDGANIDSVILLAVAKRVYGNPQTLMLSEVLNSTTIHRELQKLLITSYFILENRAGGT
jgi:hypothetical protein